MNKSLAFVTLRYLVMVGIALFIIGNLIFSGNATDETATQFKKIMNEQVYYMEVYSMQYFSEEETVVSKFYYNSQVLKNFISTLSSIERIPTGAEYGGERNSYRSRKLRFYDKDGNELEYYIQTYFLNDHRRSFYCSVENSTTGTGTGRYSITYEVPLESNWGSFF